eukprot:360750-Chlamydomonas_euryale.AAC.3
MDKLLSQIGTLKSEVGAFIAERHVYSDSGLSRRASASLVLGGKFPNGRYCSSWCRSSGICSSLCRSS